MQNTLTITLTANQLVDLVAYIPTTNPMNRAVITPIDYLTTRINHELSLAKNFNRGNKNIGKIINALNQADDATILQVSQTLNIPDDVTPNP